MNDPARGGHVVIATVQMTSADGVQQNLATAGSAIAEAAAGGAQLVVLPENFAAMGRQESLRREMAETDGAGRIQDWLAETASRARVWLVGGTLPIMTPDDPRPAAACCVYDATGARVGRYDKIHMFDVDVPGGTERYRESANTRPGRTPLLLSSPWGGLGVAVCYDLRFPELFRAMAAQGLDLLAVPAAFTFGTGKAHWEILLRARAIENLAYVAAAAQTGVHPGGRRTWGHSMVIGPWGEVLAMRPDDPGVCMAAIDMERPGQLRREFPALAHRRLGPGGELSEPEGDGS
jgi:nitrilase